MKRLLDNVKTCIIELMHVKVPEDGKIYPRLKQARKDMQRLFMQSDEFEDNASTRVVANRPNPSLAGPLQSAVSPRMGPESRPPDCSILWPFFSPTDAGVLKQLSLAGLAKLSLI
jgi:hypothetical protein